VLKQIPGVIGRAIVNGNNLSGLRGIILFANRLEAIDDILLLIPGRNDNGEASIRPGIV